MILVKPVGGYVELLVKTRKDRRTPSIGRGDERSDETLMEQRLRIDTKGHVYHPNLLDFTLAGLFGFQQTDFSNRIDDRDLGGSGAGSIWEFDFSATLLKKKPYPVTVYARRSRDLEARPFRSSIERTTTSYGLNWQYVSATMPTNLRLSQTDVRLDPFLRAGEVEGSRRNTVLRFDTAYKFSKHNELSLIYGHEEIQERPLDLTYSTDEITLTHRLRFGEAHGQRLESQFRYFDQRGTIDNRRSTWRQTLRLQHADNLRSWVQLDLLDRTQGSVSDVETIGERSYRISGGVEHKLYDSLVSQIAAHYEQQNFDGGLDIRREGLDAILNYRKKNRWGALLADYSLRVENESRTGPGRTLAVVDERITLSGFDPVFLAAENISAASITVIREDRTEVYRGGTDYLIRRIGDRTEIERIPTGRIGDAEAVLVSYRSTLSGDFDLDTINQQIGVRQTFDWGLSPYYRFRQQDQRLSPRDATGIVPEDITAHTLGVDYRLKSLRFSASFEDYGSSVSPFEAVRLSGHYTRHLDHGATAALSARWSDINYGEPFPRITRLWRVEAEYRNPIARGFSLEAVVGYYDRDDTVSGDSRGVDVDFSLEWRIRETEVLLTYEVRNFDDDVATNESSAFVVRVKRRF